MRYLLVAALVACGGGGGTPLADAPAPDADVDGDGDGIGAALDCNDEDPAIFPGALDTCNFIDDDCDASTDEGTVVFEIDGVETDVSELFAAGTMASPTRVTPAEAGTLRFCGSGVFYTMITATQDLAIRGQISTTLDAGQFGSVVTAATPGTTVEIADITLKHGKSATGGGGIECRGATLNVNSALVFDNEAMTGGGARLEQCTATFVGVTLANNFAVTGGGIASSGGVVTMIGSSVGGNIASGAGGGVLVDATAQLELVETSIGNNIAMTQPGGGIHSDGVVTCTDSFIHKNRGHGVHLAGAAGRLTASNCFFGTDATQNNTPSDVSTQSSTHDLGDGVSTTCTALAGCL